MIWYRSFVIGNYGNPVNRISALVLPMSCPPQNDLQGFLRASSSALPFSLYGELGLVEWTCFLLVTQIAYIISHFRQTADCKFRGGALQLCSHGHHLHLTSSPILNYLTSSLVLSQLVALLKHSNPCGFVGPEEMWYTLLQNRLA